MSWAVYLLSSFTSKEKLVGKLLVTQSNKLREARQSHSQFTCIVPCLSRTALLCKCKYNWLLLRAMFGNPIHFNRIFVGQAEGLKICPKYLQCTFLLVSSLFLVKKNRWSVKSSVLLAERKQTHIYVDWLNGINVDIGGWGWSVPLAKLISVVLFTGSETGWDGYGLGRGHRCMAYGPGKCKLLVKKNNVEID